MTEQSGEINGEAQVGRRRITLDPIREKVIPVAWREVESTIPCGFQTNWVAGEKDGISFELRSGAGVSSPWMTFNYKKRGFCIDVTRIVEELITFADETDEEVSQ